MANYTVEKIDNGIATLRYADNSWTEIVLSSDMTEADLDDLALQFAPKTGAKPSFLSVGDTRTAAAITSPEETTDYVKARMTAYGTVEEQIEYITEKGLDKWQENVTAIKSANPKPS
mgnify:FL=1|tara:strand:+ start:54 stop:404 length:351 start_codon:yes stop_codon:yes gene_type:complete